MAMKRGRPTTSGQPNIGRPATGRSESSGRPSTVRPGSSKGMKRDNPRGHGRSGTGKLWEDQSVQLELIPCKVCNRRFTHDRVQLHQRICEKVFDKKRKPYDTTKHRWLGIVPENEIKNIRKPKEPPKLTTIDWQSQHNAWSGNTNAPRGGSSRRTGKPSSLTSTDDNRVFCRGCKRRFAPTAAERHIPFCEGKHNIQ